MNDNDAASNLATEPVTDAVAPVATPQKRRGRPLDPTGYLGRARALFGTLPAGTSRQDTITAFQGLGMTKDTAAAYYSVIKRSTKS